MKLSFRSALVLFALIYVGCSSQQKDTTRLPQSSMYEEAEVESDDLDADDTAEHDNNDKNPETSRFNKICREPKSQDIKKNDRVVTLLDGKHISGNVKASYGNGSTIVISTDYGPQSASRKPLELKRTQQQISKALECLGTKSKKVYGLFFIDNKFYTGHVREVYKNGVVRFVNDRSSELFTTIDQSVLEVLGSNLKLKPALFKKGNFQIKGTIRRLFEKDIVLINHSGKLLIRKLSEIEVAD